MEGLLLTYRPGDTRCLSDRAARAHNDKGGIMNGVFKFLRILNGDQTDGGLDFSSEPLVLRVSVADY